MFRLSLVIGFVIISLLPSLRADSPPSSESLPRSASEIPKRASNAKEDPAFPNEDAKIETNLPEKHSILLEKLLDAKVVAPVLQPNEENPFAEKAIESSDSSGGQPSISSERTDVVEKSERIGKEKSSNQRSSKLIKNTWATVSESSEEESEFSYANPEDWSLDYPECAGQQQSPIDLNFDTFIRIKKSSEFLFWTGYWNYPDSLTIINNGHTVQLSGTWSEGSHPFISGGPLEDDYLFGQLHFHWGPKDSVGSEHRFNNHSLSMELHMLHYKREYGNSTNAQNYEDGIAVFSILYEVGIANPAVTFLKDGLRKIEDTSNPETSIKPFPLALFSPRSPSYVTYAGSLTTPPCLEIVTWLISDIPGSISREQLALFRKISSNWAVHKNYRPLQALNGRDIWQITI